MGIRYTSGAHVALATGDAVALLVRPATSVLAEQVWEALVGAGGVAGAIQVIIAACGGDVRSIPPFAVVAPHDDGTQVAVRGPVVVRMVRSGAVEEISGAHVITWNERWLATPDVVEIASPDAEGDQPLAEWLPLVSGVVRSQAIRLQAGASRPPVREVPSAETAASPLVPTPEHQGEPSEPAAPALDVGVGVSERPASVESRMEATLAEVPDVEVPDAEAPHGEVPAAVDEPVAEPPDVVADGRRPRERDDRLSQEHDVPLGDDHVAAAVMIASPQIIDVDALPAGMTVAEPGEDGYDHLFGRTVVRSVEDAAVREHDDEDETSAPSVPSGPERSTGEDPGRGVAPVVGLVADRGSERTHMPTGLIAAVPGMSDPFADDHDGETIMRSALGSLRGAAEQASQAGPVVLARRCSQEHISPPDASLCRTCGEALTGEPTPHPRPALGQLRLSNGEVLALETGLVLGRAPRLDRFTGHDLPRVVTVPSPTREISGTHLAVRLEDWNVLVVDLGSSNGSVLHRPAQAPRRLHPHHEELVRSGDVVDLGDGLTAAFEGLP